MDISINSIDDLLSTYEKLSNGEAINIVDIGKIQYAIKLRGGRFDDYNTDYIDAEIARIIDSYQNSFYNIARILKRDYGIEGIDKNKLIHFYLKQGSLEIKTDELLTNLLGVVKNMESSDTLIILIVVAVIFGSCWAFNRYLTYNENIEKLKSQNENSRIIAELARNKDLQNACNAPKMTIVKILKDGESAIFDTGDSITNKNQKDYSFEEIDTTQTEDINGNFKIFGFEKTRNNKRKFKILLNDKTTWANADMIDVEARMILAEASIQEKEVKLTLRIIKEYNNVVKDVFILSVGNEYDSTGD